jgi:Uma2 family endonuclease
MTPSLETPKHRVKRMTYARFLREVPDGVHANLIDGEVKLEMPTGTLHERIQRLLLIVLGVFVSRHQLGEVFGSRTSVRIDGYNSFEPDVLFVHHERRHVIGPMGLTGAPDLAVKIVSPSSRIDDRTRKFLGYQKVGVREYWLIDPERRLAEFYRRGSKRVFQDVTPAAGQVFRSEAVPGFWLDPAWLCTEEPPNEYELLQQLLG